MFLILSKFQCISRVQILPYSCRRSENKTHHIHKHSHYATKNESQKCMPTIGFNNFYLLPSCKGFFFLFVENSLGRHYQVLVGFSWLDQCIQHRWSSVQFSLMPAPPVHPGVCSKHKRKSMNYPRWNCRQTLSFKMSNTLYLQIMIKNY